MINDEYLNGLAKLMIGESFTIPSYVAFGSTSYTLSGQDNSIQGEFDRIILSSTNRSNNLAKFICSRSSSDAGNETINVVELVNSASLGSSGNLQVAFLISSLVHTTDFDLEVEFWVNHERI